MHEFKPDKARTAAAYHAGVLKDPKQRSYISNTGHVFLFGPDLAEQWERIFEYQQGKCAACGLPRQRDELDLDHVKGNTKLTRCECYGQMLNDVNAPACFGVRLICTMDVRKPGYKPDGCHSRKHGREVRSDRKERREQGRV
jgi:hypothetical protein